MEQTKVVRSFCQRVTELADEFEGACYVRIRVGSSKRTSSVAASGIRVSDDPHSMWATVSSSLEMHAHEGSRWLECMVEGETSPKLSVKIPEPAKQDAGTTIQDSLANALVQATDRAFLLASRALDANQAMMGSLVEHAQSSAALATDVAWWQDVGKDNDMDQALRMAEPLIAAAATKLLGHRPQGAQSTEAEPLDADVEADAEELLSGVEAMLRAHPRLATEARVHRLMIAFQAAAQSVSRKTAPQG